MPNLLHYLVHPAQSRSHANAALWSAASKIDGLTQVDLYAEYPRHNIDVDREQQRLVDHDVIVFQFPMFWYAAPSLLKEWTDLVLEQGFAFGPDGNKLAGKSVLLAVTTGGSDHAFSEGGYQRMDVRKYLYPYEQTAHLCGMTFLPPFVFHDAIRKTPDEHAQTFTKVLGALIDGKFNTTVSHPLAVITPDTYQSVIGG